MSAGVPVVPANLFIADVIEATGEVFELPPLLRPACVAADGKTPVFCIPGYPLMVRAVDFNAALSAGK